MNWLSGKGKPWNLLSEVDELVPVGAGAELGLVAHDEEAEARPREADVHSTDVRDEAHAVGAARAHRRVEHEVHFLALEGVHGEHVQTANLLVGMLRDARFELGCEGKCALSYQGFLLLVGSQNHDGHRGVGGVELQKGVVEVQNEADFGFVAVGFGKSVLLLRYVRTAQIIKHDRLGLKGGVRAT